jgi:murein DD-endopeptidase MepM/ murein hydrolase activator NlpD
MRAAATSLLVLCCACIPPRQPIAFPAHLEPDVQGVTHLVKSGETLWRIARAYQVSADDLAIANHLSSAAKLTVGQELFIPGAKAAVEVPASDALPPESRPARAGPAPLLWPVVGVLYARFGPRGETRHDGIDIAAPAGTEVHAAADGDVVFAGEQKGYGFVVVLQHEGRLISLYAHNQSVLVKDGAHVKAGDPVARVGEALKTSGPHIHFEVRLDGQPKDPLAYLPSPK